MFATNVYASELGHTHCGRGCAPPREQNRSAKDVQGFRRQITPHPYTPFCLFGVSTMCPRYRPDNTIIGDGLIERDLGPYKGSMSGDSLSHQKR